jgi:hypothetical protein
MKELDRDDQSDDEGFDISEAAMLQEEDEQTSSAVSVTPQMSGILNSRSARSPRR